MTGLGTDDRPASEANIGWPPWAGCSCRSPNPASAPDFDRHLADLIAAPQPFERLARARQGERDIDDRAQLPLPQSPHHLAILGGIPHGRAQDRELMPEQRPHV